MCKKLWHLILKFKIKPKIIFKGVNIGTMSSNITKMTDILLDAGQKGFEKLNRMTILHILANMPAANVSIKYKLNVKIK